LRLSVYGRLSLVLLYCDVARYSHIVLTMVQEMYNAVYKAEIDGSHDWLECLMRDDRSCLVDDDCLLMSAVSSSLDLQPTAVSSEHSYSLAAEYSHSASVVRNQLEDCMYCCLSL